jgi:hypothetical protein
MFQHPDTGYHQTKLRLQRRMQSEHTADSLLEMVREAFKRAQIAEGITMSRAEQSRMLRDVLDEMVSEMLKKL